MTNRIEQLKRVQEEGYELFSRKNSDYGDAFANHGPIGVLVRLGDKIQRLQKISKTKVQLVKTESLRDTLIDLHNYAAMAIMLLDEDEILNSGVISEDEEEYQSDILDHGNQLVIGSQSDEDDENRNFKGTGCQTH